MSQSDREDFVLLGRAHADADRLRRAEAVERPDDDAFALQLLEERPSPADVDEEEVAERRPYGLEAVLAEDVGEPCAACAVAATSNARRTLLVASATSAGAAAQPTRRPASP